MDRIEIQDTISRYSYGQDSQQGAGGDLMPAWSETFTEGGEVDYSAAGGPVGTWRELARWMRGENGSMSGFSHWQHMLSLPLVTLDDDFATARTDFFASHRSLPSAGPAFHLNAAGAFHDELVRTADGWRIARRRLELYFADPLNVAAAGVHDDA